MVRTGLMVLLEERLDLLAGRRVGLVSHAAAVLPDLTGITGALLDAGVLLGALFGPEQGYAGEPPVGAEAADIVDRHTGLPLYSLYGEVKGPTPAMLNGLDALVLDFQNIGARYYTFLNTLYYVLRSAGTNSLPVFLLDRPNPINGVMIEGPLVEPGLAQFVGAAPIPIRHAMTVGELALFLNTELRLGASLTVIPMQGWSRGMWFDETSLPWVLPSPDMPQLSSVTLYPGMCFIEGTNLSEGRGTALPYEVVGAPWLDGWALAERLNKLVLPGVRFRSHTFKPAASKFSGEICEGVQVHVLDRLLFRPVLTGLHVMAACRELAMDSFEFLQPDVVGKPLHLDLLAGTAHLREYLEAGRMVEDITADWAAVGAEFARVREPYLLYS